MDRQPDTALIVRLPNQGRVTTSTLVHPGLGNVPVPRLLL